MTSQSFLTKNNDLNTSRTIVVEEVQLDDLDGGESEEGLQMTKSTFVSSSQGFYMLIKY